MEKKTWTKPTLIVLVRSEPEETVLDACKYVSPGGSQSAETGCWFVTGCTPCLDVAAS